jgi:hypothetical protein
LTKEPTTYLGKGTVSSTKGIAKTVSTSIRLKMIPISHPGPKSIQNGSKI